MKRTSVSVLWLFTGIILALSFGKAADTLEHCMFSLVILGLLSGASTLAFVAGLTGLLRSGVL